MPTTEQLIDYLQPRYPNQIRFLLLGGKLHEEDGWGNVVGHCLWPALGMEILGEYLDLHPSRSRVMVEVLMAHDGLKRLQVKPDDFDEEEQARAMELHEAALPTLDHKNLMLALDPYFHRLVQAGRDTSAQRIVFFLDDVSSPAGDGLVLFDERIADLKERERQRPNPEVREMSEELGEDYWKREEELVHAVQRELWEMLKNHGVLIDKPEFIPIFLNREIERRLWVPVVD